jgi:hypothetical protein
MALHEESVARFIRDQARARTLSILMKDLNRDLLGDDVGASALAARALSKLGFPLSP